MQSYIRIKHWSLRVQILVLVLTVVALSLAIIGGANYKMTSDHLHEGVERNALSLATIISANIGAAIDNQDTNHINKMMQSMFKDPDVRGLTIFNLDSTISYSLILDPELNNLSEMCNYVEDMVIEHDGDYCIVEASIKRNGQEVACMWLAMSEKGIHSDVQASLYVIIITAIIVLVMTLLVGSVVTARMVKPIRVFEKAVSRVGFGDMLSPIDASVLHKDFLPLGAAFNEMQIALKGAFSELASSRDQLEIQVAERTGELSLELAVRKKAEEALKFTQFTVDHGADPSFWTDKDSRFIYVNDAVSDALGYSREELLKMRVVDIEPSITEASWAAQWSEVRRNGSVTTESCLKNSTDDLHPVEMTINFMEYQGQEYNCAFARDITERKKIEERRSEIAEQLERAQRMESIGVLAGGVAHDLNNMLGPVVGYTELLLMSMKEDSKVRKRVERISKSATAAANVIQDLLALARRGRYEMIPVSLNEVVARYVDSPAFIQLSERRPDISFVTSLDEKARNIVGSEAHLEKVVMNLIVNAYDAMPDGGALSVSTSLAYLEKLEVSNLAIKPGLYEILKVTDSGNGISAEDVDRIFEPYYSNKKMGKSGSGLGLSVVYGIVKDHKGYYDVNSEPGNGTQFILYFPTTSGRSQRREVTEAELRGTESILLVEDSAEQREIANDLLESLGYRVRIVNNGHEALDFLNSNTVDVIALDMIMEEGFDGLDTYREIIKRWPAQKVIIVTGYSATERVEEMQELGAGACVRKPYTRESISLAIRGVVDRTEDQFSIPR